LCVKVGDPRVSPKAESEAISDASSVFGANEWLVDELYEQYLQDKNAVDPAWWDFFEDYRPAERADAAPADDEPAAPVTGATAPAPRAAPAAEKPPAPAARAAPAAVTDGSAAAEAAQRVKPPKLPADPAVNAAAEAVHAARPVATAQPATAPYAQVPARKVAGAPTPEDEASDDVQKLRGPAARVVTNMEASIQVPTATSVRAVPAKLMVDNRIVINNHLQRGRGGKISFTH